MSDTIVGDRRRERIGSLVQLVRGFARGFADQSNGWAADVLFRAANELAATTDVTSSPPPEAGGGAMLAAAPPPPSPVPSSVSEEMVEAAYRVFSAERGASRRICKAAIEAALALAVPRPSPSGQYGELVKRLRIKADMIHMGEAIAFGSEVALMFEAADAILALEAERDRIQDLCSEHIIGRGDTEEQLRKAESRCAELEKAMEVTAEQFAYEKLCSVNGWPAWRTMSDEARRRAIQHTPDLVEEMRASLPASPDQGNTRKNGE